MADIEGIARGIYDIIISPETVTGLINGGLSVPLDYGYLIYGIHPAFSLHRVIHKGLLSCVEMNVVSYSLKV